MYKGGYTGKILRINLTEQTAEKEELPLVSWEQKQYLNHPEFPRQFK